jgi:hypothetical protein
MYHGLQALDLILINTGTDTKYKVSPRSDFLVRYNQSDGGLRLIAMILL